MAVDSPKQGTPRRLWQIVPVAVTGVLGVGLMFGAIFSEEFQLIYLGPLAGALVLVQAAFLWLRSRRPRLVLVVVTACDLAILLLSSGELGVGTLAVMIAVYSARRRLSTPASRALIGGIAAAVFLVTALSTIPSTLVTGIWVLPFAAVRVVLAYAVPYFVAEFVVARARLLDALRERAELAERDRERSAQQAVQQERALMARELHDIAAHHLTGIIVSAQAAGALMPREPERSQEYLRTVIGEAQLTLSNLRETVGLLRDSPFDERSPLPAVTQIPDLVGQLQARGLPVTLQLSGEPVPLGPLAEITAYRMVQESLTNAERHAPGAGCDVSVIYSPTGLTVRVENVAAKRASTEGAGGHGLLGMRERADLVGGRLHAGPTPAGGWANELFIPSSDPPAPSTPSAATPAATRE